MDEKDILEAIERAKVDTKYVLDDKRPTQGIKKTLSFWLFSYFVGSVLTYIITKYTTNFFLIEGVDLFYIQRYSVIIIFSIIVILYFIYLRKTIMTIKEKEFLKTFSLYIIMFSILRILQPVTFILNFDVLIEFYNSLPIDILFIILALFSIYSYVKNKSILIFISINFFFFVLMLFVFGLLRTENIPSDVIIHLSLALDFIKSNGLLVILSVLSVLFFLNSKKEVYVYE